MVFGCRSGPQAKGPPNLVAAHVQSSICTVPPASGEQVAYHPWIILAGEPLEVLNILAQKRLTFSIEVGLYNPPKVSSYLLSY